MYYILTDGNMVYASKIIDVSEVADLQEECREATDGDLWWEPGSEENVERPKWKLYKHLTH